MTRTLFLDLRNGIMPERLAGALVDMGVAPSPLLFAAASLGLPASMDFERTAHGVVTRVGPDGGDGSALTLEAAEGCVERAGLPEAARALASLALLALYEAHGEASRRPVSDLSLPMAGPEGSLQGLVAAALAVTQVAPERVLATGVDVGGGTTVFAGTEVEVPSPPVVALLGSAAHALSFSEGAGVLTSATGAALLRALVPVDNWGVEKPVWRGYVSRGCGILAGPRPMPLAVAFGDAP